MLPTPLCGICHLSIFVSCSYINIVDTWEKDFFPFKKILNCHKPVDYLSIKLWGLPQICQILCWKHTECQKYTRSVITLGDIPAKTILDKVSTAKRVLKKIHVLLIFYNSCPVWQNLNNFQIVATKESKRCVFDLANISSQILNRHNKYRLEMKTQYHSVIIWTLVRRQGFM